MLRVVSHSCLTRDGLLKDGLDIMNNGPGCPRSSPLSHLHESID